MKDAIIMSKDGELVGYFRWESLGRPLCKRFCRIYNYTGGKKAAVQRPEKKVLRENSGRRKSKCKGPVGRNQLGVWEGCAQWVSWRGSGR